MSTRIVNLFGGPGSGKSTTAAGLFHKMKLAGMSVELVTEFAKQLTWQERQSVLSCEQAYVHAKQLHYLDSVVGKVDWIVTDSPTLLSAIYAPPGYPPSFRQFVREMYLRYDNTNVFVQRVKPYVPVGRSQSEDQARVIDRGILDYLWINGFHYHTVDGNESAVGRIINIIKQ